MRKFLAALASMALVACTGLAASEPGLLRAEADLKSEISILPVDRPLPAPGTEVPLRVHFDVKNTTLKSVHLPVIEARVMGADGVLRGFFGVQLTAPLAAGESSHYVVRSDAITVRSDDTIVLVPVRREEPGKSVTATQVGHLFDKMTAEQCDTYCASKESVCLGECNCGVRSFSCGCGSGGGFNYSCECMMGCKQ